MRKSSQVLLASISSAVLIASIFTGSSLASATDGGMAAYDPAHAGGTVTLVAAAAAGSLDPKINYKIGRASCRERVLWYV